jgi:hypothetical protein
MGGTFDYAALVNQMGGKMPAWIQNASDAATSAGKVQSAGEGPGGAITKIQNGVATANSISKLFGGSGDVLGSVGITNPTAVRVLQGAPSTSAQQAAAGGRGMSLIKKASPDMTGTGGGKYGSGGGEETTPGQTSTDQSAPTTVGGEGSDAGVLDDGTAGAATGGASDAGAAGGEAAGAAASGAASAAGGEAAAAGGEAAGEGAGEAAAAIC